MQLSKRSFDLAVACLCLGSVVLVGCESELDETENKLVADAGIEADLAVDTDAAGSCPAVGTWYLFDTLSVVSIAGDEGHGAIPNLNTIWADDIARKQLNILFEVIEVDDVSLKVRAMNAARLDDDLDGMCRVPATIVEIPFDRAGNDLTMSEKAGINIYAGSESIPKICAPGVGPKHTIPIREAQLAATFAGDCTRMVDGVSTEAIIFGEDLRRVCSCLAPASTAEQCGEVADDFDSGSFDCDGCNSFHRNLHKLLEAFVRPNEEGVREMYEIGEDGRERLQIRAAFSAVQLDAPPPVCP